MLEILFGIIAIPRAGATQRWEAIQAAINRTAAALGRAQDRQGVAAMLQRAVLALDDAWSDVRDHPDADLVTIDP